MDSITITGQQVLLQRMKRVRLGIPPVLGEVGAGKLLKKRVLDRFDREVGPDGQRWKELSPMTLKRRRDSGRHGTKILNDTGALRASIDIITTRADGLFAINSGLGVRIGVTDEGAAKYGRLQQRGGITGNPPHRVPPRPFLGLNALDVKAVRALVYRRMVKLLKG